MTSKELLKQRPKVDNYKIHSYDYITDLNEYIDKLEYNLREAIILQSCNSCKIKNSCLFRIKAKNNINKVTCNFYSS